MFIKINGRPVECEPGEIVLEVAKRAGIKIPHLCALPCAVRPIASCRLCMVEIEGNPRLATSCTLTAYEGLSIFTHTPRLMRHRRTIIELLLAGHPKDCFTCSRAENCELLKLAHEVGARKDRYTGAKRDFPMDISSPSLVRDPNKCILCGRCVEVCHNVQHVGAIHFAGRGFGTSVTPSYHEGLNTSECVFCGQCIKVCPTGALSDQSHIDRVIDALADPNKLVVAQMAPSIPATIMDDGQFNTIEEAVEALSGSLKAIGFDAVYDTTWSADLTIMEEANELVERVKNGGVLPMFTSCSPAWIRFVELHRPEFIPNLSTCKSPQAMAGAVIKDILPKQMDLNGKEIFSVSIMPCTAKKYEAETVGGDIDAVLTTRELKKLLARFSMPLCKENRKPIDSPFAFGSGAGRIFGATGGVMEAALRTAYKVLNGEELSEAPTQVRDFTVKGARRFSVNLAGKPFNFAVVSGLGEADKLLDYVEKNPDELQFIEVMSCPGGCVAGGGQPHEVDGSTLAARIGRLAKSDKDNAVRVSHENPEVKAIYEKYLEKPLSHESHRLLHREYKNRRQELLARVGLTEK